MIPQATKDVKNLLTGAYGAIKGNQLAALHGLSDHVLHSMLIYQDRDITNVALAIYSLDKIFEQEKFQTHPKIGEFTKKVLGHINDARAALEKNKPDEFAHEIDDLLDDIARFSQKMKGYLQDILQFAKTKKASKLYEHGLSLGKAAEVSGTTKWELMPATGETVVHEQAEPMDEERLKLVKKLFGEGR